LKGVVGFADTGFGIQFREKYVFLRKSVFATGRFRAASVKVALVAVRANALAAQVLVQVASLASRHGQITVRAAFFCLNTS
jgi:hypothetical protein